MSRGCSRTVLLKGCFLRTSGLLHKSTYCKQAVSVWCELLVQYVWVVLIETDSRIKRVAIYMYAQIWLGPREAPPYRVSVNATCNTWDSMRGRPGSAWNRCGLSAPQWDAPHCLVIGCFVVWCYWLYLLLCSVNFGVVPICVVSCLLVTRL